MFGFIKLTKNTDPDKYGFHYWILWMFRIFIVKWSWIFGTSNSSSRHTDITIKDILVLVEGPTQGLDGTATLPKARYSEK